MHTPNGGKSISPSRVICNYCDEIELIAYCLMPNHFHLLLKQNTERGIAQFMKSMITRYVGYFNHKYRRVEGLFQGRYKAVMMDSEAQFIGVSKYIHRNPLPVNPTRTDLEGLGNYRYSSYPNYLGRFMQSWLKMDDILHYYPQKVGSNSYKSFVEETGDISSIYYEMIDLDE
jgi:putative transposase